MARTVRCTQTDSILLEHCNSEHFGKCLSLCSFPEVTTLLKESLSLLSFAEIETGEVDLYLHEVNKTLIVIHSMTVTFYTWLGA